MLGELPTQAKARACVVHRASCMRSVAAAGCSAGTSAKIKTVVAGPSSQHQGSCLPPFALRGQDGAFSVVPVQGDFERKGVAAPAEGLEWGARGK